MSLNRVTIIRNADRFELEERHTWLAASLEEKDAFLKVVQTMCERYNVGRKTKFLNIRPSEVPVGEAASARGQGNEEGVAEEEAAYQAISAKETTDLRALMQVMIVVAQMTKNMSFLLSL